MIKNCIECGKEFKLKNGRQICCSEKCSKERSNKWRKIYRKLPKNIEKEKEYDLKPSVIAHKKIYNNTKKQRENRWEKQGINITVERYNIMLEEQNGNCSICGLNTIDIGKNLCVDHNHETGEIRGLLCDGCNTGIGRLNDNINILASAISYLKQEPKQVYLKGI